MKSRKFNVGVVLITLAALGCGETTTVAPAPPPTTAEVTKGEAIRKKDRTPPQSGPIGMAP